MRRPVHDALGLLIVLALLVEVVTPGMARGLVDRLEREISSSRPVTPSRCLMIATSRARVVPSSSSQRIRMSCQVMKDTKQHAPCRSPAEIA